MLAFIGKVVVMAKDSERRYSKSLAMIKRMGFQPQKIHFNLSVSELVEIALIKKEAKISSTGALSVFTGKFTGRSPDDRDIIEDNSTNQKVN